MYLGVDYYPEHWSRDLIDEDLANIKELGCNIIRIGDFAWDVMEPQEGQYDFSLFDEVIKKAGELGIKTMMCTPTATMPRWLNLKYPEIMSEDEFGNKQPYGGRRGYCYNSEVYRQKAMNITRQLGMHYKNNENIVAWQLDNEIGHEGSDMCYCQNCHKGFIEYLKTQFSSIEELNDKWGTRFWTQTYSCFEDIHLPKTAHTAQNPTLRLYWERYRSLSIVRFLKDMYSALKEVVPNSVILHDFEGGTLQKHFDPFEVSKCLDDVAYNNYPVWGGTTEPMTPAEVAFTLDTARGFKNSKFWITEEIMGAQGHDIIGCAVKPNQGSTWAIQAMAHGCKSFLIFRYRGYNKGAEQYCYGILDADNQKRRKFYEVKSLYQRIRKYQSFFEKDIVADAAIMFDYDSAAAFRIQRQSDVFDYVDETVKLYSQLYDRNMTVDVITKDTDFNKYKLLILPYMIIMDRNFHDRLKRYVTEGGKLVLTARTSWKDVNNTFVFNERLPYGLNSLVGAVVEETESLLDGQKRSITYKGHKGNGTVFADMLKVDRAEPIAKYLNNAFGNYAAVTKNKFGKGYCYYIGTSMNKQLLTELFDEITDKEVKSNPNMETIIRDDMTLEIDFENLITTLIEKNR